MIRESAFIIAALFALGIIGAVALTTPLCSGSSDAGCHTGRTIR